MAQYVASMATPHTKSACHASIARDTPEKHISLHVPEIPSNFSGLTKPRLIQNLYHAARLEAGPCGKLPVNAMHAPY